MRSTRVTRAGGKSACLAAIVSLPALLPTPLHAQSGLAGIVTSTDSSRRPVAGVELVIAQTVVATTDSAGVFLLTALRDGLTEVLFRKIGWRPVRLRAFLAAGDTLRTQVRMDPSAVELAPIEVRVSAVPVGMESFAEHRAVGLGTFLDAKVLRATEFRPLSEAIRMIPSVWIERRSQYTYAFSRRGPGCPMQIILDGIRIYQPAMLGWGPPRLENWKLSELEAIEVYDGPATTPSEYNGTGANCGTLVLWTRRR